MSIFDELKKKGYYLNRFQEKKTPLWAGPEAKGDNGGVTFSLLSRFLVCRERFRLYVVEGLKPADTFDHKKGYGDMWHVCEEEMARHCLDSWCPAIEGALKRYTQGLCHHYKLQQEQIIHWHNVCKVQFPHYINHWKQHEDVRGKKNLLSEQVFDVPYMLPSGREVRLRGKWDSVDLVTQGPNKGVWLQENKTKGDINEIKLHRQLTMDLQTMLYVVTLDQLAPVELGIACRAREIESDIEKYRVKGVRYNVVRRPLSGGKGTITRHKGKPSTKLKSGKWSKAKPEESPEAFYKRVEKYITDDPAYYFMRFNVTVRPKHVERFKMMVLNPILEQLCDWWDYISLGENEFAGLMWDRIQRGHKPVPHWLHPYGVWNSLNEGGSTDLDDYIEEENEVGLRRVDTLFPELNV